MRFKITAAILTLLLTATQLLAAQGIVFKEHKNWAAVQEQARKEHKYIFIAIGGTFCAPCHLMERDVFSKDSVGAFYNNNFINIKLQADKTTKDDTQVKNWYKDTEYLLRQYKVTAYPTYLYLSPQGELVYQYVGTASPNQFIAIAAHALDPKLSVSAQTDAFDHHQMKLADEGAFALFLAQQGHHDKAEAVAKDYNDNFLNKSDDEVLKRDANLKFLSQFQFIFKPGDQYFKLLYNHGPELDALMKSPGRSYRLTNRIIIMNEVWSRIYENGSRTVKDPRPDWGKIKDTIAAKYSAARAERILPVEKYRFYNKTNDWPLIIASGINLIKELQLHPAGDYTEMLNQVAYNIFEHSEAPQDITLATQWVWDWITRSVNEFALINTYSCLLYKQGKKQAAIAAGQQSITLLKKVGEHGDQQELLPVYQANLGRMKSGASSKTIKRTVLNAVLF